MLKVKFELNINGVIEVIVYHGKGGPATQGIRPEELSEGELCHKW